MHLSDWCGRFVALAALWMICVHGLAMGQTLDGRFLGLGTANGAELVLDAGAEIVAGTIVDPGGRSQAFEANRSGEIAEAVIDLADKPAVLRLRPVPSGLEATLIPIGSDGRIDVRETQILAFRREGLEMPPIPEDFTPPPGPEQSRIAANSFLASYEFWSPSGVRAGYLALSARHRRMIKLFPAVQLDVIWKLCQAEAADDALALALRDQPLGCSDVLATLSAAQADGRFNAYKTDVRAAAETLRITIRCADNYVMPAGTCAENAKALAAAAVSLETTASVLARYR